MTTVPFIKDAIRTESIVTEAPINRHTIYTALQVMATASLIADSLKRGIFYGKGMDWEKLSNRMEDLQDALNELHFAVSSEEMNKNQEIIERLNGAVVSPNLRLLHGAVGIFSEAGEMIEALAAQMESGQLDKVNFAEENGDVDWYQAVIYDESGVGEEATREAVINKLKARFPDKFDSDQAHNRDLDAERAALEEAIK